MTKTIVVRSVSDRIARTSPRGPFIPSDRFITVDATPYIMRLLNVHKDIELAPPAKVEVSATAKKEV